MISVYIKKSDELAKTPTRANDSDAGYDLYSTQEGVIPAGGRRIVKTGISNLAQELEKTGYKNFN